MRACWAAACRQNDMNTNKTELIIVGSIGLDDIETPFETRKRLLGGSVSYACAAASYFLKTGMVGVVGDDFPEAYVALYKSLGIDLSGLQRAAGKTFVWSGVYDADMINRKTLSTGLNVFADFSPVLPETYREAPYILLANISPELQLHVLEQAVAPTFVVADTMNLWIDVAREPLMEVISRVNMLTLNDEEARMLAGEHNLRACAGKILEYGPQYVVIKKGEHGAILFSREGIFITPAYPVNQVCDPTGAGDAFAGGFMGSLAKGGVVSESAIRRALLYGSAVASFAVEQFSLDGLKDLTPDGIQQRLDELMGMMVVGE